MGQHVVPIDGVFDTDAASSLHKRLVETTPAEPLVLDFSHARDVHDCALAAIAHGLACDGLTARYRGLLHHQERMLLYLGFDTST